MKIDPRYRSFYYQDIKEMDDIEIEVEKTALLLVDLQIYFASRDGADGRAAKEAGQFERWEYFYDRLDETVIPNNIRLLTACRQKGIECTFGRIASLKKNGNDRCRVQRTIGWNNIYVDVHDPEAGMMPGLEPMEDEIVVNKTTDSVSLGTNYTQILRNMGIDTVIVTGIVTDQCVANTIRVLADQGFRVICVEDCCAAGNEEQHNAELKIMNIIYCSIVSTDQMLEIIEKA